MITLKESLALDKEDIKGLKQDIAKANSHSELNAYIDMQDDGMDGVPIAIKDNINVKDWQISCASKILKGYVSPYSATVIKKLQNGGLSAYGRTNMDEFAMGSTTATSVHGKTLNPINPQYVPGGSSGGSAAAVGAGLAVAALGSDTGGSIRQPAAFCGCVGMKPTYGRVSRYGLVAFSSSLDQIGPITQNVEDAAILYDKICGHDSNDSTSADTKYEKIQIDTKRKLTIAVIENYIQELDEQSQKALQEAIDALEKDGHTIVYKKMLNTKYDIATYYIVATAEASANLSRFDGVRYGNRVEGENLQQMYLKTRSEGFGDEVKRRIMLGNFVLSSGYYDAYYIKAQKVRHLIKDEYEKIFNEADLIFSPVSPSSAFKFGQKQDPLEMYKSDMFTLSVNLAGLPAISLPVGKGNDAMPIAAQFIAKHFDEQTLFDGASALEQLLQ
ncbi:MAG: Asp-tRNA(Asn)/Glu-tRNA(Gln) amidotransferase subunit GatA [Campylobacterota bacterium]